MAVLFRMLGEWLANLSANSFSTIYFSHPPPQNARPELSAFLSNIVLLNPNVFHTDFLLAGEHKIYCAGKILPQVTVLKLITRGNSASCSVATPVSHHGWRVLG